MYRDISLYIDRYMYKFMSFIIFHLYITILNVDIKNNFINILRRFKMQEKLLEFAGKVVLGVVVGVVTCMVVQKINEIRFSSSSEEE